MATENRSDGGREEGSRANRRWLGFRRSASASSETHGAVTLGTCEGVDEEWTATASRMAAVVAWIASRSGARAQSKPSVTGSARAPDSSVWG
jgi:hypothetical protein